MVPSRLLAAVALVSALCVPAAAGAVEPAPAGRGPEGRQTVRTPAGPALLEAAAAVGTRHWGAAPCGGKIRIVAQRPVLAGLAPDTDAWASFDSPAGANNLAGDPATYSACTITFARWRWPSAASMREDWDLLCTTMVHELGHLLGHGHSDVAASIMAPVFTDLSSVPRRCRETRPGRSSR
jgi:hypothetical protein